MNKEMIEHATEKSKMKFGTKAIHAGIKPDPATGAIMVPIYQTSTFVQSAPGVHKGFEYARTQNPTRFALEHNIASIENGKYGACFGSGMGAVDAVMKLMNPGDEIISTNDLYGGSYRTFTKIFERYGLKFHFVDMTDVTNVERAINEKTKMIWIETPTNPMMAVIDIQKIANIAKQVNVWTAVDNTFATPCLQLPLDLGADIVVHSATKYLGGHSDVILGSVVVNDDELAEKIYFTQNGTGAVPGPFDCFLVLRGIKTLHLRMQRHSENGRAVAEFLASHPKVRNVYWPGFPTSINHDVAVAQMKDFGGMVSFTLKNDSIEAANKVMTATKIFYLAESLGGVESLIGHPASMTHASIPREERIKSGLVDSLIRLSVGVEHEVDLLNDLELALATID